MQCLNSPLIAEKTFYQITIEIGIKSEWVLVGGFVGQFFSFIPFCFLLERPQMLMALGIVSG